MAKEMVGVILAGGQSRRMGTDKALLGFEGVPLVERSVNTLLPLFQTVAIVAKDVERFRFLRGAHLVRDLFEEQHALGGIYTALSYFSGKGCFIFACDLPFLNPLLISAMLRERNGYDLLVPRSRRGLEPLHAIYTERCLERIAEQISRKQWCLDHLIPRLRFGIFGGARLHRLDPEERSFVNINTPQDISNTNIFNIL